MRGKPPLVIGMELGSSHFTAAAGRLDESHQLVVQAVESVPTQGMDRGVLSDPIECTDTVSRLVRQLERTLSTKVTKAVVAIPGNHLKSYNTAASIPIADPSVGISRRDVEKAVNTCRTLSLDYDRQILHAFERGFAVDGQPGIKDPVGLCGNKLTVELHLVTALNMAAQNITRVLNRAGIEVEHLILPGIASAEAVLTDLDKDLGVTLIHIGENQTEVLIFTDGRIRETLLLPWGTDNLGEGLSRSLKLPKAMGEQLFDQVRTLEDRPEEAHAALRVRSGSLHRSFPKGQVVAIVAHRVQEFLGRLRRRLDETPYFRESAAGIVIVGAAARLEGFLEMAESTLNMPVRLGTARELKLDPQVNLAAMHTTAVGLLRHAVKHRIPPRQALIPSRMPKWLERFRKVLEEYF